MSGGDVCKRALSCFVYVFSSGFLWSLFVSFFPFLLPLLFPLLLPPFPIGFSGLFFPVCFFFRRSQYILILIITEINNRKTRRCTCCTMRRNGSLSRRTWEIVEHRYGSPVFQGGYSFFRFDPDMRQETSAKWWRFRRFPTVSVESGCSMQSFSAQVQIRFWFARCSHYVCCCMVWGRGIVGFGAGIVLILSICVCVTARFLNLMQLFCRLAELRAFLCNYSSPCLKRWFYFCFSQI